MTRILAHALPRSAGGMNKTEAAYAERLQMVQRHGAIRSFAFQAVTLKLADDTRYTPDFFVIASDGVVECHEVKGFWRDDAKVKIKVAARLFPFRFMAASKSKTGWKFEDFTDATARAA